MSVVAGDVVLVDGSLSGRDVIAREARQRLTTSAPSPGAFLEALERAGGRAALVATVSSSMSSSYEAAMTAASYRKGAPIAVVDTKSAAGGEGLVVMEAARTAGAGGSLHEVARAAQAVVARVRLVALVEHLEHLARSGRVPGVAAWAGRSLGVRPLFELTGGTVRALLPSRTSARAIDKIAEMCLQDAPPGPARLHAAVLDATSHEAAQRLSDVVREAVPGADVYGAPFSAVMVAHTGPGLTGLAWWWEPPDLAAHG